MGSILYVFWPMQFLLDTLRSSEIFMFLINGAFYPLIYLFKILFAAIQLLLDLLWPIKALLSLVLRSSFSLVWNIVCLPFTIL